MDGDVTERGWYRGGGAGRGRDVHYNNHSQHHSTASNPYYTSHEWASSANDAAASNSRSRSGSGPPVSFRDIGKQKGRTWHAISNRGAYQGYNSRSFHELLAPPYTGHWAGAPQPLQSYHHPHRPPLPPYSHHYPSALYSNDNSYYYEDRLPPSTTHHQSPHHYPSHQMNGWHANPPLLLSSPAIEECFDGSYHQRQSYYQSPHAVAHNGCIESTRNTSSMVPSATTMINSNDDARIDLDQSPQISTMPTTQDLTPVPTLNNKIATASSSSKHKKASPSRGGFKSKISISLPKESPLARASLSGGNSPSGDVKSSRSKKLKAPKSSWQKTAQDILESEKQAANAITAHTATAESIQQGDDHNSMNIERPQTIVVNSTVTANPPINTGLVQDLGPGGVDGGMFLDDRIKQGPQDVQPSQINSRTASAPSTPAYPSPASKPFAGSSSSRYGGKQSVRSNPWDPPPSISAPTVQASPNKSPWPYSTLPDYIDSMKGDPPENELDEASRLRYIPVTMSLGHYERLNQVGEGTYGKVYKARDKRNNLLVALKKVRIEPDKDGFPITGIREIKILTTLHHPNIVKLNEIVSSRDRIDLVFEYMDHDLTGLFANAQFRPAPSQIKCLMRQMFEGLNFLHTKGIMHRDLKGSNLLVDRNGNLKIADFGLARHLAKALPQKGQLREMDYTNRVITLWYRPPELLMGATKYGTEVDMWSAGVIFLEFFARKTVFPGDTEITQLDSIIKVCGTPDSRTWPECHQLPWYDMMLKGKPHYPSKLPQYKDYGSMSKAAFDLLESLLQFNPKRRPTAAEVLRHTYFNEEPLPCHTQDLQHILPTEDWHEWESKKRREALKEEKEKRAAACVAAAQSSLLAELPPPIDDDVEAPVGPKVEATTAQSDQVTTASNVSSQTNSTVNASKTASTKAAEAFRERMAARLGISTNINNVNVNTPNGGTSSTIPTTAAVNADNTGVILNGGAKKAGADVLRKGINDGIKKDTLKAHRKSNEKSKEVSEKLRTEDKPTALNKSKANNHSALTFVNGNKSTDKAMKSSIALSPPDSPHDTTTSHSNRATTKIKSLKVKPPKKPVNGQDLFGNAPDVPTEIGRFFEPADESPISKKRKRSKKEIQHEDYDKGEEASNDTYHEEEGIEPPTTKKVKAATKKRSNTDRKSASNVSKTVTKVQTNNNISIINANRNKRKNKKSSSQALPFPPEYSGLESIVVIIDPPAYQSSPEVEEFDDAQLAIAFQAFGQKRDHRIVPFEKTNVHFASLLGSDHFSTITL